MRLMQQINLRYGWLFFYFSDWVFLLLQDLSDLTMHFPSCFEVHGVQSWLLLYCTFGRINVSTLMCFVRKNFRVAVDIVCFEWYRWFTTAIWVLGLALCGCSGLALLNACQRGAIQWAAVVCSNGTARLRLPCSVMCVLASIPWVLLSGLWTSESSELASARLGWSLHHWEHSGIVVCLERRGVFIGIATHEDIEMMPMKQSPGIQTKRISKQWQVSERSLGFVEFYSSIYSVLYQMVYPVGKWKVIAHYMFIYAWFCDSYVKVTTVHRL